jgi:hypothetical protein
MTAFAITVGGVSLIGGALVARSHSRRRGHRPVFAEWLRRGLRRRQ